jgi:hypothetical protein
VSLCTGCTAVILSEAKDLHLLVFKEILQMLGLASLRMTGGETFSAAWQELLLGLVRKH